MMQGMALLLAALQAASPRGAEPQDPDRPQVSAENFKALSENNIFSPPNPRRPAPPPRREEKRAEPKPPLPPPRPRPPVVTGLFWEPSSGVYQVIVEDRNTEASLVLFQGPKFLKAGEEIIGYRIESVTKEKAVVKYGSVTKEVSAGESFPEGPERAAPPKSEVQPVEEKDPQQIIEELRKKRKGKRVSSDNAEDE